MSGEPLQCSDPPEESCSDAGCPVHGDEWDSADSNAYAVAEEAREAAQ